MTKVPVGLHLGVFTRGGFETGMLVPVRASTVLAGWLGRWDGWFVVRAARSRLCLCFTCAMDGGGGGVMVRGYFLKTKWEEEDFVDDCDSRG